MTPPKKPSHAEQAQAKGGRASAGPAEAPFSAAGGSAAEGCCPAPGMGPLCEIAHRKLTEETFRSLLEAAPDAMIVVNQQRGIELVNAEVIRLFGYTSDELIGQPLGMLVPERRGGRHAWCDPDRGAGLQPLAPRRGQEWIAQHRDGHEFPVEISLSPLETSTGTFFISALRDITERKQAEADLRDSQRFAQSTLEAIPASLAVLDETGAIISTNEAWNDFARANGAVAESIGVGVNYLALCDGTTGADAEEAHRFAAGIRAVISGASARFSMEYPCHAPNQERWYTGYITAFAGDGPPRVVIAHVDITERKQAEAAIQRLNEDLELRVEQRTAELRAANEELRQQMEMRRQLEAEILEISEREQQRIGEDLHDDLGQQIAGIWCLNQVLESSLSAQNSPETESVSKITLLLKDALALTRSLARGLHPVALQKGSLIIALEELAQRTAEVFHVKCRCRCQPVDMDTSSATHLYRIAQEAVTNAIKHGQTQEIEIELSSNPHHTLLSVRDYGTGLPALDLKHVKGMGVRIMNYRADMIGGVLEIENQPDGPGTLVTCTIPTPRHLFSI